MIIFVSASKEGPGFVGSSSCLLGFVPVLRPGSVAGLLCLFITQLGKDFSIGILLSLLATIFRPSAFSPRLPPRCRPKNLVSY